MADNSVRNNSPDPSKYHPNVGGMPGTMIPRASRDGESLAFDHNVPRMVVVDPGEAGGGFTLDMSALSKSKEKFNSAALRKEVANDPTAFYRGLSDANKELTEMQEQLAETLKQKMKEPVATPKPASQMSALPPISPVPTYSTGEKNMDNDETSRDNAVSDTQDAIRNLLQEEKVKADIASERRRAHAAMHNDSGDNFQQSQQVASAEMAQMREHMAKQSAAINSLIGAVERITANPEPAPEPTKEPVEEEEVEVVNPLESLQIPFLSAEKPQRPQYETYFEMAKMGTMAARYHAVVVGKDCLALVYDTRFEDGFQYLPPNLGEEQITVSVPKLGNEVYTCSSLGLHWTLGCLDIVILIKHGDTE